MFQLTVTLLGLLLSLSIKMLTVMTHTRYYQSQIVAKKSTTGGTLHVDTLIVRLSVVLRLFIQQYQVIHQRSG